MSGAKVQQVALGAAFLIALVGADTPPPTRCGDEVTLKDGKVVVGEIVDGARSGGTRMILRRDWFQAKLPERYALWLKNHTHDGAIAARQRRDRLKQWRAERTGDDKITRWIDAELKRLEGPPKPSELILVDLSRGEVKSVKKAPKASKTTLRLAWRTGLKNAEETSPEDLKSALEGRGLIVNPNEAVDLADLLPAQTESDSEWLAKRASTEVLNDPGLKLIRHGTLVMPEPDPGAPASPDVLVGAVSETIRGLLDDRPAGNPLTPHLRAIEAKRKVGALVTQVEMSGDGRNARGTCTLWVRTPGGWISGPWRSLSVNAANLPPDAAKAIADDPQVAGVFKMIDQLGIASIDPSIKNQALAAGAASRHALGQARSAIQRDLEARDLTSIRP